MIEYVSPGQKIQASTMNQLISQANFNGTPTTSQQFTIGPNGNVDFYTGPTSESNGPMSDSGSPFCLQCQVGILDKGAESKWSFYIGNSTQPALDSFTGFLSDPPAELITSAGVSADGIVVKFGSEQAAEVSDDSISATGWLSSSLTWPSNADIYIHQYYQKKEDTSANPDSGATSQNKGPTLTAFAISDKKTGTELEDEVKEALDWEQDAKLVGSLHLATTLELSGCLSGAYTLVQCAYPPYGSTAGRPKADSEVSLSSSTSGKKMTKSLQWSDDLTAYQLYDFKAPEITAMPMHLSTTEYDEANWHYVKNTYTFPADGMGKPLGSFLWRKEDTQGASANKPELNYSTLSFDVVYSYPSNDQLSGDIIKKLSSENTIRVDSDVADGKQRSLQWNDKLSAYQVYDFTVSGDTIAKLKEKTKKPVVLSAHDLFRSYDGSSGLSGEIGWKMDYAERSQMYLAADASLSDYISDDKQPKSIDVTWKTADVEPNAGNSIRVASLHNFDKPEAELISSSVTVNKTDEGILSNVVIKFPSSDDEQILYRKGDGQPELKYGKLSIEIPLDLSSSMSISVDSKSIDLKDNVLELHNFSSRLNWQLWPGSNGYVGVQGGKPAVSLLFTDRNNELKYGTLSIDNSKLSADTNAFGSATKSIDITGNVIRLHNFGNSTDNKLKIDEKGDVTDAGGSSPMLLYKSGNELKYGTMSTQLSAVSVDCDIEANTGSIQRRSDGALQIKNWSNPNVENYEAHISNSDLLAYYKGTQPAINFGSTLNSVSNTPEAKFLCQGDDSSIKYGYQQLYLPQPPIGDTQTVKQSVPVGCSIEELYYGYRGVYQLYGFDGAPGSDTKATLEWGSTVQLFGGNKVLYRSGDSAPVLQYGAISLTMPEKPDIDDSATKDKVEELEKQVESQGGRIDDLDRRVSQLEDQVKNLLSNDYWVQGGSASTNYGASIGNENGDTVITFGHNEGIAVEGDVAANGAVTGLGLYSKYLGVTLGSTTLTEDQLKKLLALIS